ncbi:hypothetical protein ACO2FD_04070 [Staphylococcus epidermidis]
MDLNHYKRHYRKRLGHANIEITWRVYSHLLKVLKSEEVAMPDNIIYF